MPRPDESEGGVLRLWQVCDKRWGPSMGVLPSAAVEWFVYGTFGSTVILGSDGVGD